MVFTQFGFFIFLAVVFCVHWSLQRNDHRKLFLLVASYFFYGLWDWRFLSLILISTLMDYILGIKMEDQKNQGARKRLLVISLVGNLGILFAFKYFNFFIDSAVVFLGWMGIQPNIHTLNIILPAGISFYTFQTLSYTIDVYRGSIKSCKGKIDFALFVAFFPQLVAGPIVRASDFIPQLSQTTRLLQTNFRVVFVLFTIGFIKKSCIADNLSIYVDAFYHNPSGYDAVSSWLATILYAIQIYCDFSGYSDMAIATAAMFGYKLCINFAHPYFSLNITDFWRRWHISLSTWLRDYLYFSLGGNRISKIRTEINLMITMLLGGLWHGASWNFVVWGGLHGLALALHKQYLVLGVRRYLPPVVAVVLAAFTTFIFVNFCWVFFRAQSFADSLSVISQMTGLSPGGTGALPLMLFGIVAVCAVAHFLEYRYRISLWFSALSPALCALLLGLVWVMIMLVLPVSTIPFIYFQF